MSLKVWLPLTGDLENKGSCSLGAASVQSGVSVSNDGKIGKCYKNTGTNVAIATSVPFFADKFTLCAWVRVDTRVNNWGRSIGMYGNGTYLGFGCEATNGTGIGFHFFKTIDGTNTRVFDAYPFSSDNGTWVHYAMAYDGTKYYIYKNGSLVSSANADKTNIKCEMTTLYLFGGSNGLYVKHSLNDVRVYDHCLSAAEVHEIAQGLVCHYKLDLPNENLLANSIPNSNSTSSWYSAGTGWANSVVANGFSPSGYVIRCTYSGTSATQGGLYHGVDGIDKVVNGAKYTLSAWVRASKACQATFCQEQMVSITPSNTINLTTSWKFVSCTGTIDTSKTYKACILYVAGSYVTQNMWIECCNMKFEAGEKATTWCPHTSDALYNTLGYNSTAIKDSSGYGNNGTITGTITSSTDSAKYSSSAQFSNNSYITHKMPENMYYATYSFWIKAASYTAYGMVYGPINNPSGGTSPWFAINTESSSLWAYFGGNSPSYTKVSGTLSTNVWHHCV